MTDFSKLTSLPEGAEDALAMILRFDQCLATGFSRLSSEDRDTLEAFAAAFGGSPLAEAVTDAKDRLFRSEFVPTAFVNLAAGRVAILGAIHDSLRAQFAESAGIESGDPDGESHSQPPGDLSTLMASAQQWLVEMAVSGFQNLSESQLTPFASTLEQIQTAKPLTGLSALLTGMLEECLAIRDPELIPISRWADFWATGMIGSQQITGDERFETVAGDFHPLGVDIRTHQHMVVATFYGVLDGGAVRMPFTSYKVGVISGDEIWKLFRPQVDPLLTALEKHETVKVAGDLTHSGDLRLSGKAAAGSGFDPFALPISKGLGAVNPLKRHPIHLAELIHIPECKVDGSTINIDGNCFPLALDRIAGGDNDLPGGLIQGATEMIALARFDCGQWQFQPLAIKGKPAKIKKGMLAGEGTMKRLAKLKGNSLEILQERAGKLLRG